MEVWFEQILEEGAFRRRAPVPAHRVDEHVRLEADDPNLVPDVDHLPGDGRAYDRGPRRPQARPGLRHGADGRPQARGVRADADLPRALRRPQGGGEAHHMSAPEVQEVRAAAKWVRISPRKARLVVEHIRGRTVPEARTVLAFTQRAAAREVEKLLRSAVANAEANHNLLGDDLVVKTVYVDEGPMLKRWRARARGRSARIRKRTCHITLKLVPATTAGVTRAAPEAPAEKPKRAPRRKAAPKAETVTKQDSAAKDNTAAEDKPKRRAAAKPKSTRKKKEGS